MRGAARRLARGAGGEARIRDGRTTRLAGAMIAVGHSDRAPEPRYLELRRALMQRECRISQLRLGRAAARARRRRAARRYVEFELSSWDAMAGLLLVEEAGGRVAPFPGRGGFTVKAPVVAAAAGIFGRAVGARAAGGGAASAEDLEIAAVPPRR